MTKRFDHSNNSNIFNAWQIRKPAVESHIKQSRGMVASQHYMASQVGAAVLAEGGNAIDAAIAAGFTLGAVEPWMSGIGGGGYMTVYLAETRTFHVVEFGMQAPALAVAADYPLAPSGTNSSDAFNWPTVVGNVNVEGPLSIAVPGYIRGMEQALQQFGSWQWSDVIAPATRHAERGLPIDWFSSQKINQWARNLRQNPESQRVYLEDGLPPVAKLDGTLDWRPLGRLAQTYQTLSRQGPEAYYTGEIANQIVADLGSAGSKISHRDLARYQSDIVEPLTTEYRGYKLHVSGELTAGPSIVHALNSLQENYTPGAQAPDGETFVAIAEALRAAYADRLANLGEGNTVEPGNTSHLCVADAAGNVVSLTQTIMSAFGSRVMLPGTGIMMNNGMMWFDPRAGGANSVAGGRKPLCNMCPVILEGPDGSLTAIGACGGRKIFPAVFQLVVFIADYGMSIDNAAHHARIDVSGTEAISVMDSASAEMIATLQSRFANLSIKANGVSPNLFGLPQLISRDAQGTLRGGCFIPSPHAAVVSAS